MVTCKMDTVSVPKMNSVRARKPSSSNSSGFRLLDGDQLEATSSISKNSFYKLKIDLLFDGTRSVRSNRLDDTRGSHRTRSIIMYGRSELAGSTAESTRSIASIIQETNEAAKMLTNSTKKDVQRISNSVQAQIEQMFTDVAKDATASFAVTCLGALPLKDKVSSLLELQEPLRELYLRGVTNQKRNSGFLEISGTGLRVKTNPNNNDVNITPFHNIAVWSAVKFVVSEEDGGAAFLPLITDPEKIDKSPLFQPLSSIEQQRLTTANAHAPIFAVVMRSAEVPKLLECHGFICKSTEDAIVIAATLYQSLIAHVNSNSHRSTKRRTPRNQNGVSCISIASSSAMTGSNYLSRSQVVSSERNAGRKSSFRSSSGSIVGASTPSRSSRKKRVSNSSLSSNGNVINEAAETTTEERKRKSHKTKRAPPVPNTTPVGSHGSHARMTSGGGSVDHGHATPLAYLEKSGSSKNLHRSHHHAKRSSDSVYKASEMIGGGAAAAVVAAAAAASGAGVGSIRSDHNGDILTRVAIPRSGSFLNTGGLTRYKSRAARRHSGKLGGGGGGSPLGFSELFNEFRLHENLHSLDDILSAIIDADGMSFNDLKPIYKEFLLKLAITLTPDELFQRSKNIMRRQKKKKRKISSLGSQKKHRTLVFNTKSLKKVFQLGQFRSCREKPPKPPRSKNSGTKRTKSNTPIIIGPPTAVNHHQPQRSRVATSGSDVSVVRAENGFQGLNRNSSSGYVSCSECSYDSEACTCTSADRCYCSLRTDHYNNKLRRRQERKAAMSKKSPGRKTHTDSMPNRSSLISCRTDDKCYCSMVEEEPNLTAEDETFNTHSDTTWCDTDSCVSASKCYCKRSERRAQRLQAAEAEQQTPRRRPRSVARKPSDKFALDYELFSISGNSKSVQPDEALSVKKSVEAAAIFADVKLSQTTDIKSLCPPAGNNTNNGKGSCRSHVSTKKYSSSYKKRESYSIDHLNEHNAAVSSHKSCSADDLLSKLTAIEKAVERAASIKSAAEKHHQLLGHFGPKESFQNSYQSMRAVSATLEDTLGYLP